MSTDTELFPEAVHFIEHASHGTGYGVLEEALDGLLVLSDGPALPAAGHVPLVSGAAWGVAGR
jgi:hypothetical protein